MNQEDSGWTEIIIHVSEENADAVSDFLISHLGRGVMLEEGEMYPGAEVKHSIHIHAFADRDEIESGFMDELDDYLAGIREVAGNDSAVICRTGTIMEADWRDCWKKHFRPIRVGRRFLVKPSWEKPVQDRSALVLEIDPGQAFGVGTHASTALVLETMEELCEGSGWMDEYEACNIGLSVMDLGTGTGILGIAAAKLGAGRVLCLETDPQALAVARRNALVNGVAHILEVEADPVDEVNEKFQLIVANLDRDTLITLAESISRCLSDNGRLIVSGILVRHREAVMQAFSGCGLHEIRWRTDLQTGEWACMVFA